MNSEGSGCITAIHEFMEFSKRLTVEVAWSRHLAFDLKYAAFNTRLKLMVWGQSNGNLCLNMQLSHIMGLADKFNVKLLLFGREYQCTAWQTQMNERIFICNWLKLISFLLGSPLPRFNSNQRAEEASHALQLQ